MEELFSNLKFTETDKFGVIGTGFRTNVEQTVFWAHGAWLDILSKVFEYLPIKEKVRLERVCKLFKICGDRPQYLNRRVRINIEFQAASKISWRIVKVLDVPSDIYSGEKFKLILNSYSQRIPKNCKIHSLSFPPLFAHCSASESRGLFMTDSSPVGVCRIAEDIAKSVQKFYLPSLKHLGVFCDSLAGGQALVNLAKAHPTVETLGLTFIHQLDWSKMDEQECGPAKIIENLPNLQKFKITIAEHIQTPRQIFPKIAPCLETFHLSGHFDFTNAPSFELPALKEVFLDYHPPVMPTYPVPLGLKNLAKGAPGLTRLNICVPFLFVSAEEAVALSKLPLESLSLQIGVAGIEGSVLRLIDELANYQSTTRATLQHLILYLSTPRINYATITDAYLNFRCLKTLAIQSIYYGHRELVWPFSPNVYIALNGKLDHLDIPGPVGPGPMVAEPTFYYLEDLVKNLVAYVQVGFPENPKQRLFRGFSCYTKYGNLVKIWFMNSASRNTMFEVDYELMDGTTLTFRL